MELRYKEKMEGGERPTGKCNLSVFKITSVFIETGDGDNGSTITQSTQTCQCTCFTGFILKNEEGCELKNKQTVQVVSGRK